MKSARAHWAIFGLKNTMFILWATIITVHRADAPPKRSFGIIIIKGRNRGAKTPPNLDPLRISKPYYNLVTHLSIILLFCARRAWNLRDFYYRSIFRHRQKKWKLLSVYPTWSFCTHITQESIRLTLRHFMSHFSVQIGIEIRVQTVTSTHTKKRDSQWSNHDLDLSIFGAKIQITHFSILLTLKNLENFQFYLKISFWPLCFFCIDVTRPPWDFKTNLAKIRIGK